MYRILHTPHHRTGDTWCIYPMYDYAHGQSDSIEGITHSLCSLEYEDHRPLYDWFLEELEIFHPRQIEFARLNLSYTVVSKRKLIQLVREGTVSGWDDPRMPPWRDAPASYTPDRSGTLQRIAPKMTTSWMALLERTWHRPEPARAARDGCAAPAACGHR
jgi:glutaminyl-tRNA synthetase